MSDLAYYQRNRDVILRRAKVYYENDKERLRRHARDLSARGIQKTCLKKKEQKKGNMEKIDIIICLKKKNKD